MENELLNGIYLVLIFGAFYFMMFRKGGCCGHSHGGHDQNKDHSHGGESSGKTEDPVCGMEVNMSENSLSVSHEGKIVYFCADQCMKKFEEDPARYIKSNEPKQHGCC